MSSNKDYLRITLSTAGKHRKRALQNAKYYFNESQGAVKKDLQFDHQHGGHELQVQTLTEYRSGE
jgi:hypothetical protein